MVEEYISKITRTQRIKVSVVRNNIDLEMIRGDTLTMQIRVSDEDDSYLNLTSAAIIFMAKENITDDDLDAKIAKSVGSGITIDEATNGLFTVVLSPSDTEDLDAGNYYYDIEVTDASSNVYTVMIGLLTLIADVTRG